MNLHVLYLTETAKNMRLRKTNTIEQKRRMKRERRIRKRQMKRYNSAKISEQLTQAKLDHEKTIKKLKFNQKLAQLYWDRWRHEVQERKHQPLMPTRMTLTQIPSSALLPTGDSREGKAKVVGRGSFGIVKHMLYRGINVAVKEFDSKYSLQSISCEANFLSHFNHPNLPLFFGYNTISKPYYLIIQFYGIDGETVTLHKELTASTYIQTFEEWLMLCGQLAEALRYLHYEANCLHNDIKSDNVLLTKATQSNYVTPELHSNHSIVLIDFNKATRKMNGRRYTLSPDEKTLHYAHSPHLAPEVIEGTSKQTCASDIFAAGRIFKKVAKRLIYDDTEIHRLCFHHFESISTRCISENVQMRPCAKLLTSDFKNLLNK